MNDVTDGLCRAVVLFLPVNRTLKMVFDDADGTGSTVVVEKIVPISGILGAEIFAKCIDNLTFFIGCQVEYLLLYPTLLAEVILLEINEGLDAQFIIDFPHHKTPDEVRLVEREGSVIEYPVARPFDIR